MYDAGSAAGAGGVRAAVSELARTCLELYPPLLDRDQLAKNAAKILLRAVPDSPEREEAAAGGALHRTGPHRAAWPSVLPENPDSRPAGLGPRSVPTPRGLCLAGGTLYCCEVGTAATVELDGGGVRHRFAPGDACV